MNDAGDFVGNYTNEAVSIAFSNIGGITAPIIIPGDRGYSFAYAINRSRQITGGYQFHGHIHGWWQDSDGTVYAPFDPPHSKATLPFGVNDQGWVVGRFSRKGNATDGHGFLHQLGSDRFVIYDYPGATFTSFGGINNDRLILDVTRMMPVLPWVAGASCHRPVNQQPAPLLAALGPAGALRVSRNLARPESKTGSCSRVRRSRPLSWHLKKAGITDPAYNIPRSASRSVTDRER